MERNRKRKRKEKYFIVNKKWKKMKKRKE